jgi:hypothetical protein
MKYRSLLTFFVSLNLMFGSSYAALVQDLQADDEPELIQLYSQNELNMLISDNKHLERVLLDECQFTKDIEDRAMVLHYPSYLYLWADMNFTNTCVNGDPAVGVRALKLAAEKAMPAALYKLGQLYHDGKYVQKDPELAYRYVYNAASLKDSKARIMLVELQLESTGKEIDYENAYNWLFFTVFSKDKDKERAAMLLNRLGDRMPSHIVKRARIKEYN